MKNSFLTGFSIFIYCVSLVVFIICWQFNTLTQPKFLKNVLAKANVYNQLDSFANNLQTSGNQTDFTNTAFIATFIKTLDKNEIQKQIESFIDQFYVFLKNKSTADNVALDLRPIKDKFTKKWPKLAPTVFSEQYNQLPSCSGQVNNDQITCKNADLNSADLAKVIGQTDTANFLQSIPDQITLAELFKESQDLNRLKTTLQVVNIIYLISLILIVLSLIGIVTFSWPDYRGMMLSIGVSTFILTLPTVLLLYFGKSGGNLLQANLASNLTADTAAVFNPMIKSLTESLFNALIKLPFWFSLIGLLLLISGLFMPKMEEKVTPPGFENKTT